MITLYAAIFYKMVRDTKVYELLKTDPTPKLRKNLVALLTKLKEVEKITQDQHWHLYPTSVMIPRLYGSPRIHKEVNLLRPIVDYTGPW